MESGFSSLWHCLTFFLGSWARPHARQVSKPHWYIDWRVSQTFNHLKKGDQDLSGAVCEDVLWLADKGKPQKQDESNLAEQFVQKIIRKMSHTSCAQKIQVTHGITFHLALPKRHKLTLRHIDHRELGMVGCFLVDPRSIMGRQVRITHQAANFPFHMEIIAQEIHRFIARRPITAGKVHIWPCNDSTKHHPWWDTIGF